MPYLPPNEDTVHFVGGIGTKADRDQYNGGGCTQAAWDSSGELSDFMGTNGGPKTSAVNATYTNSTKTVTATGIGNGVTVGTLAYLSGTNITTGVYEITAVTDNDNVVFGDIDASGDNTDTTINVGGALDNLQNALDNSSTKADSQNRVIYTNLNENLTAAIDIDGLGGSISNNTKKKIIGFHTTPGDMDEDGSYYQGPLDAYINGIDTSKCVTYDAQGNDIDIFEIDGQDNIEFRNIYFYNAFYFILDYGVRFTNTPISIGFVNCKFDDVFYGMRGTAEAVVVQGCYEGSAINIPIQLDVNSHGFVVFGSVFNVGGSGYCAISPYGHGSLVISNIFIGGQRGIVLVGEAIVCHNTFYNQTVNCIRLSGIAALLTEFNNIFMPAAADDYAVYVANLKGTVLYSDYSWAYCSAGNFTVDPWYDDTNDKSFMGSHSTKDTDPEIVDVTNGVFRPLNPAVLRGGRPDIAGNPGQIGMVIQKYQFTQRARQVNRGRLAIIR